MTEYRALSEIYLAQLDQTLQNRWRRQNTIRLVLIRVRGWIVPGIALGCAVVAIYSLIR
jgi:integral membrane sensor domain MASE1